MESESIDFSDDLRAERSNVEEEDEVYLALHHGSGKIGGAFYNVPDGVLYVINDLVDPMPQCRLVLAILSQLNPKFLLVSSRHHETYDKAVQDLNETETTERSSTVQDSTLADMSTKLGDYFPNMTVKVISSKEFGLESARRRVYSQRLPGESQHQSAEDHHLMIHSLINQTCDNMLRACGALLKYLDKHHIGGFNLESGGVPILAVNQFTPQDIVRIDETSLSALQIFSLRWQTSGMGGIG